MVKVSIMPPPQEMPSFRLQWFVTVDDVSRRAANGSRVGIGALYHFACRPTQRQVRRAVKLAKAGFERRLSLEGVV